MKRYFFSLAIILTTLGVSAQLSIKGDFIRRSDVSGVHSVVVFSKIDNRSEIHYNAGNSNVKVRWFSFSNGIREAINDYSTLSSTHTYVDPQHNTGYIVSADGVETVLWVVDGSRAENKNYPDYETPEGDKRVLQPVGASYPEGRDVKENQTVAYNEAPFEDTPDEVGCSITVDTAPRDSLNENKRPTATSLEGSAPLDIRFYSNPTGNVTNYLWQLYKDGNMFLSRTEMDIQYTFTETGTYKVKLLVSNDVSEASDSVEISLLESAIAVPKIFTPNGDGFNDEFRVAFTSLAEFDATVLNRWGRVVYRWSNPQSGWDGNINGKPAPEGTYFYIIRAKGSDNKPYLLKGHINLLR